DNAFVHWFLKAFLTADDELAARSVTGVPHDKGVDAVFVDDIGAKVFVLQGKCHLGENPPHEKRQDVLDFARLAQRLTAPPEDYARYREKIDPLVGKRLDLARQCIRKRRFSLHLYYVTTGKCSSPLKDEAESEVAQAAALVELSILDRREILAL